MNKRQKEKFHNAMLYGALTISLLACAWVSELIVDGNIWAIATWIVCWSYIALFIIANKVRR